MEPQGSITEQSRLASAIAFMATQPRWEHVEGWHFRHDGLVYDLSASNLEMLDEIVTGRLRVRLVNRS